MARPKSPRSKYKSDFEHRIAISLANRGVPIRYEEEQLSYEKGVYRGVCNDCGSKDVVSVRSYTPDWTLPNGILVESKGKFTPQNRSLMLDVIKSNPDRDIRMVFQADNWLTRKKKTKYSDWCKQHDIKCAVGDIPDEWLQEDKG